METGAVTPESASTHQQLFATIPPLLMTTISCRRETAMLRRWHWIGIALVFTAGLGALVAQAVLALPPATIEEAVRITLRQSGANIASVSITNAQCVPSR